jgi:DNA polymerase-3 subunit delta
MTAVRPADVDRFLARPDPARPIVLVYGPDAGLVRERVDQLVRASVDDPADPFALARIDGEDLSDNPARLVEEAHTVPLFGGRRAVLVKAGGRNIAAAVEKVIAQPSQECRVIIEAGDLRRNAPLRVVCEKAEAAAVLPCYPDGARDLERIVDEEMRQAGLAIAEEARLLLIDRLGGDRLASRNEVRKLALYARGTARVERADVEAVVCDASSAAIDGLLDAAFAGKTGDVEGEFAKTRASGVSPAAVISAAIRHVATLHRLRLALDAGEGLDGAMRRATPPLHFMRQRDVEQALRIRDANRFVRIMERLAEASFEARRHPALAESIAQRALLSIALGARTRDAP